MKKFLLLLSFILFSFVFISCDAPTGFHGIDGKDGINGVDGKSAYELYCEANPEYTGTLEEWLEGLQGEKGADGKDGVNGVDGKSAYELYCEINPEYTGTLEEWLESLQGEKGADGKDGINGVDGKSAYELYKEIYGFDGTEEEWLNALLNGELGVLSEYKVTFDYGYDEIIETQTVQSCKTVERPEDPERLGYIFKGWYSFDGVEYEKWSFNGYVVSKDITLYALWDYVTYELPIVNISTFGAEINSKENYTDMVFTLENAGNTLEEITGGIRLRGNSTMGYEKKPYRIKFDKKQSLFGLEKAKSWVLLAEYLDPSALHNATAFALASQMPGLAFTPTANKVNVYLNGEFKGLYTLCEQVQENEGRMNIEMDEITADMTDLKDFNFFISMDRSVWSTGEGILDETYFYLEEYDQYFELKYPEKGDFVSEEQFRTFFTQLKAYVKEIMDAFRDKNVEKIKANINVNSLIDYMIIDQIMGEMDHAWKSFHMYYTNTSSVEENGKLNFGPIWDYDWSLYTPWTGTPNESYEIESWITYSNLFFQAIVAIPEFEDVIKDRFTTYALPALESYIENYDSLVASISESVALNQELWYADLDEEISKKNMNFLKEFLMNRIQLLSDLWGAHSAGDGANDGANDIGWN